MTDRRRDSRQVFQPADGGRKVQSGGDFDQLQDVPLQPAAMTDKALIPDRKGQIRRPSVRRDTARIRTAEAIPPTMKAQGDGDPLRIAGSLQRVNMFVVRHNSFFPYTGPGCPVPVVFLSRATVREAPATILMIVSENPFFAAPVSSCYLYQILV